MATNKGDNAIKQGLKSIMCVEGNFPSRGYPFGIVGMIKMFAGNDHSVPETWLKCNGALLPIAKYPDLFAAIGNKYGGDGTTNFALPKLNPKEMQAENYGNRPLFLIATRTLEENGENSYFTAEVVLFGGETPPTGWMFCDGQDLQVNEQDSAFIVF